MHSISNLKVTAFVYMTARCILNSTHISVARVSDYRSEHDGISSKITQEKHRSNSISMAVLALNKAMSVDAAIVAIEKVARSSPH